ncbi:MULTISPECIES: hypothetical protein [Pseudooceanicola]|nr:MULTISPECIES: hypothetical protein [Pseudooceanicola]
MNLRRSRRLGIWAARAGALLYLCGLITGLIAIGLRLASAIPPHP